MIRRCPNCNQPLRPETLYAHTIIGGRELPIKEWPSPVWRCPNQEHSHRWRSEIEKYYTSSLAMNYIADDVRKYALREDVSASEMNNRRVYDSIRRRHTFALPGGMA